MPPTPSMKNDPSRLEDKEIITRVLNGDVNAFEHLLEKYKTRVFKIARRHVPQDQAEETAHEVFIRVFQSLPSFKGRSGFKTWLESIAVRTCYDYWRKHYQSREVPMSSLTEKQEAWLETVISEDADLSLGEKDSREEAREVLGRLLEGLTPEERMVLELVHLEERSVKEAATLTGWSTANVKVRSFRARRKLQKMLGGKSKNPNTNITKKRNQGTGNENS